MAKKSSGFAKFGPIILSVMFVVALIAAVMFAYQSSSANQKLGSLSANYNNALANLSTLRSQNGALEYNLSHTDNVTLFYQKTVNLPRYNYTYTYNSAGYNAYTGLYSSFYYNYTVTWGRFNYTFIAPYPGYIIFNGTSTIINNPSPSICAWEVSVSNKLGWRNVSVTKSSLYSTNYTYVYHYPGNDGMFINLTSTPWTQTCPVQSVTYDIPVNAGKNYLLIDNDNSTFGQTVTFSAKYVGYR